jgi:hypothetical protein
MQSIYDYISSTETAMKLFFNGINSYLSILDAVTGVVFITSEANGPARDEEFKLWMESNSEQLKSARIAERQFMAEAFALDTLCGAVLQVAEKAIELYSQNTKIPDSLPIPIKQGVAKFCIGRSVRSVPLGLVIYAARNQHTHFNDSELREPSASIFNLLATAHGLGGGEVVVDPAFDVKNPRLLSLASNVTALIEWRSYANYQADMYNLLLN